MCMGGGGSLGQKVAQGLRNRDRQREQKVTDEALRVAEAGGENPALTLLPNNRRRGNGGATILGG